MDATGVDNVLVVSKTHLDVGFTDLAEAVRRRYLDDFFPRAIATAAELRSLDGPARLRWTTGSWILSEALEHGAEVGDNSVELAVERGDLCWHAIPFTMHTEYADRSLIEHGLSISARLDKRFGRRTRAAKMTDVPGHTRGLVSLLADAGVDFLHIGVNPASASPEVPPLFRWRSPGGAEIVVMYQADSYGSLTRLPGASTVVAVDMTGDNLGPRSTVDVIERFATLSEQFPGARVRAASLDDVADVVREIAPGLPLVGDEIGDTWIHGVGSDPYKASRFRALSRLRRSWIDSGLVPSDDPALAQASTRLLLVAEHTWGLDQKTHWPDRDHWSVADLATVRGEESTARFEESWAEQRRYLDEYVNELAAGGLDQAASEARAALSEVAGQQPRLAPEDAGMEKVEGAAGSIDLGPLKVAVDASGALGLQRRTGAGDFVDLGLFAELTIQTFDSEDFERRFSTYNASTAADDIWWARLDNTKPGLETSGAASKILSPKLRAIWTGSVDGCATLVTESIFDQRSATGGSTPVSAPERCVTTVSLRDEGTTVEFDLRLIGFRAARWPQAIWWRFNPVVVDPGQWKMIKLGEPVSPMEVVRGGARRLHCVDKLVHPDGSSLEPVDSGLVAPGEPKLLEWDNSQPDMGRGWSLCLYDNVWGTNFPMWIEGDARFRVVHRVGD